MNKNEKQIKKIQESIIAQEVIDDLIEWLKKNWDLMLSTEEVIRRLKRQKNFF